MRLTSKFKHTGTLALLGLLVMFWGCGKSKENRPAASNQGSQTTQTVGGNATGPEAPVAPAARAIATADGDMPGIRIEVQELKRTSGDTVNLKFTMINDSDQDMDYGYDFGEGSTTDIGTIAGTHLIDAAGKKKYFVVRDTEGACLCSRGLKSIKPRTRASLFAKFPAPPDDVQKITVVIPHFGPIEDVPISR